MPNEYDAGRKRGTVFPDEKIAKKNRERNSVDYVSFPLDLGVHSFVMNFVKFGLAFDATPKEDIIASVALPLPGSGMTDKSGLKYNQDELGLVGGSAAGVVGAIADAAGGGSGQLSAGQGASGGEGGLLDIAKTVIQGGAAGARKAIDEVGMGLGGATDLAFGNTLNPHVVLLFKNVDLKTFTLNWKLAPQSRDESQQLKYLIRLIQQMSHPEQNTAGNSGNFFLNYPNQVDIYYAGVQENLHYFKRCAITSIEVNYQPEGDNLLFAQTAAPARVDLTLGFQETEIWTADDYIDVGTRRTGEG